MGTLQETMVNAFHSDQNESSPAPMEVKPRALNASMEIVLTDPKIIVEHLSIAYSDGTESLKDIFLAIPKNAITVLFGPAGGGKSTLLRTINRLNDLADVVKVQGHVWLDGVDILSPEIDVIKLRYRNVILGGIFAGLAGAWFTLDFGTSFQAGMTNGRGFIALAALIFGRWIPMGAFGAALLFAAASSLSISIRTIPPTGDLGNILTAIPDQFWSALPYIVTIIILAGVVGRSVGPAAVGKPYERESAS